MKYMTRLTCAATAVVLLSYFSSALAAPLQLTGVIPTTPTVLTPAQQQTVVINNPAILTGSGADFSLKHTLGAILTSANLVDNASNRQLFLKTMITSFASKTATNQASGVTVELTPRPGESQLVPADMLDPASTDFFQPVGIFNRLDLAPANFAYCGEYRIVYERSQQLAPTPSRRMTIIFKDKLDKRRLGVILFGFCVVLFIFHPGGNLLDIWSLLILVSSFAYSWQLLVVRHIGSGESRAFMYLCGYVMNILIGLVFLANHYVPLTSGEWTLLMGMGFIGAIGLLCISYAFQEAPSAAAVAPYHYTQIIWGALLGYYVFNEVPNTEVMVGAVLIILAGLYLIHHETRKAALKPVEA